ncbi:MAG: hypothetical protein D6780_08620, partial [Candidatus Dadabacteria bacterium]
KEVIQCEYKDLGEVCTKLIVSELKRRQRTVFNFSKKALPRLRVAIGGDPASGKTTVSSLVQESLKEQGVESVVISVDNYYYLTPKVNWEFRKRTKGWLGPIEINLSLLEQHLKASANGLTAIKVPVILFEEESVFDTVLNLKGKDVVLVEGTHSVALENVDLRLQIEKPFPENLENYKKRGREPFDGDGLEFLRKESEILQMLKARADYVLKPS